MRAKSVTAGSFKLAFLTVLAFFILFGMACGVGGTVSRNSDWVEPDPLSELTVPIMIGTNGVHTEIVMPARTPEIDWHIYFPPNDLPNGDRGYTHVAVSWGERAFFLETETWADLDLGVAANALTGGDGIFHVAHYVRPAPSDGYRVLHIRTSDYAALTSMIKDQLVESHRRTIEPGYGSHDLFYDAHGTYHLGNTCNQWTADQLAAAGVKIGWWSPLAEGVMQYIPHPAL